MGRAYRQREYRYLVSQMRGILHPWHDITFGAKAPYIVNAVIEIPKGSKAKFELDKASGLLKLDRVLYSAVHYPANYGFIPQTYDDDKDPLDIMVICSEVLPPNCIVEAKVIGVMKMIDAGDNDSKIIAVAAHDASVNHINEIHELPPHTTREMKHFFEEYKVLENKSVVVEDFLSKEVAFDAIRRSIQIYRETYGQGA